MPEMNLVIIEQERLVELIKNAVDAALKSQATPRQILEEDEIFTRNEAASFLNVTPQTVSRHVRAGKIKAGILGEKYRFKKSDLLNYVFSLKK